MTVTLTPQQAELVTRRVASGEYPDAQAVITQALLRLVAQEVPGRPHDFEPTDESPELEAMLLEGLHSPAKPWDPEELRQIVRDLERKHSSRPTA